MTLSKTARKRIIYTILLLIGVIFAFWRFIRENTSRIHSQNEEYLHELTIQRADSIDNLLAENVSFIKSTAFLYAKSLENPAPNIALIRDFEESTVFEMLRFIDVKGDNYTSHGVEANLADRAYFQDGMNGGSGITYVLESRVTGETQIGFYTPVIYEDEIIGVMIGFFGETFVKNMLAYQLFGVEGQGWLCLPDGTLLGSTVDTDYGNYLTYMTETGRADSVQAEKIASLLSSGGSGSFGYTKGNLDATGYAVSLESVDWVLIRNFPPEASAMILENANREGMVLIGVLIAMFFVYALLMAFDIYTNHKKDLEAAKDSGYISEGMQTLFNTFTLLDFENQSYRRLRGESPDPNLPPDGSLKQYFGSVLRFAVDKDAVSFVNQENLMTLLRDTDRVSTRIRVNAGAVECFTYNFIVVQRKEGEPELVLSVCQDVTGLYRQEQQEQQRLQNALDAAESANRAKTEFLFNMSHDLRTPMNAIIGFTELAQREEVGQAEMQDFVQKIDASGRQLLALINDILEMSRIESGVMELEPERADLILIMKEVEDLFRLQMDQKQIRFTVDAASVEHRYVLCDAHRLNRILLNLISNAWKFTPEGKSVTVTLRETGDMDGLCGYQLSVKDTGIGMSAEFAEKVFTPFERERTSTVSKIQGTGLGMSITKKIVDLMGGTIECRTEQGRGTEFIVNLTFPVTDPLPDESSTEPEIDSTDMDFSGLRVLLTEDVEINREIAEMILSEKGCVVDTAENGKVALQKVSGAAPGDYDLILMDIQMPEMNGYEAAAAIRALDNPALASIPIIAMTANAFKEDQEAARAAGMNGHIAKPLDTEKMFETIARVLKKNA